MHFSKITKNNVNLLGKNIFQFCKQVSCFYLISPFNVTFIENHLISSNKYNKNTKIYNILNLLKPVLIN